MNGPDKPLTDGSLSFEEALKELEQIVRKLEEGRVPLEDAVKDYERGAVLKEQCDRLLRNARLKIQEIMQTKEGEVSIQPSGLQELVKE